LIDAYCNTSVMFHPHMPYIYNGQLAQNDNT
jgi:hypothetical protein